MSFEAGKILQNIDLWKKTMSWFEEQGGQIPPVLKDAVASGKFNLRHKSFTNNNPKHVMFRSKKYKSKEELIAQVFDNSNSIYNNLEEVKGEILDLQKWKAIKEISESEALSNGSVISPILFIIQEKSDGTRKTRLVHHDIMNCTYSKPKFTLARISQELERIADFDELSKCDKTKCFYGGWG